MKIWYLSAYDQPRGSSSRTYDFARELVRRGHEVTMFTNSFCHFTRVEYLKENEPHLIELIDGIKVVWLKTRPYFTNGFSRGINMLQNVFGIFTISKKIKDKPDVILGPSVPIFTGWVAAYLAKKYCIPFIYEVRDVWPDALVEIGAISKKGIVYNLFKYIEKKLYREAAFISSTLPLLKDHIKKIGCDTAKLVWIPNGVDLTTFIFEDDYKGGDGKNFLVMYVGGFGLDHDVQSIIRTAKILQESQDLRFYFVLIGDGVLKHKCIAEAASYNLKNIEFRPPISKSSIANAQKDADILIASIKAFSSYRFGLNLNKLCGYFASGRPILLSGNPPNDPVKESGSGLSVKAEEPHEIVNALHKIASMSSGERLLMGARGKSYAENVLSMNVLCDKMEAMLLSAIKNH
jgi:glycosyltransferase involved in cell wall biosynthesis